ncbi:hypothetical protein QYZ45_17535 [Vibrio parahaemolyticus]|nr:hypothetical protein [Vibrio parahaemolyticus]
MSDDDYPLMSEYGIVTPRGAFDLALDTVLEGYPVQAQLIPSSRNVFIRERIMKLNTMKPHLLFVPLAMMLLNGCVSQDYLDRKANADARSTSRWNQARSDNATPAR